MVFRALQSVTKQKCKMWKPEILGILLISLAVSTVNSLYFHIAETERKCFIEEIPDDTTVIGMLIIFFHCL